MPDINYGNIICQFFQSGLLALTHYGCPIMNRFPYKMRLRHNIELMNINNLFSMLRFFYPVSILYFQQVTGSFTMAMGVFSFASLMQVLFEIPLGILSDRLGRRGILILGCLAEFIAVCSYALAMFPPVFDGWVWLFLGGALFGFAEACFSGNNYALLYETLAYYKKTSLISKILGRNNSMTQIGLASSGAIAAFLLYIGYDFADLILFSILPFGLALLTAFLTTEPPKHFIKEENTWAHLKASFHLCLKSKPLRILAMAEVINTATGMASHSFMPKFISLVWPTWAVPLYRLGQNATGAISFWQAGSITQKFGAEKTLFGGSIISVCVAALAFLWSSIMSPFFLFITQITYATGITASETLKQNHFSDAQRSTMGSLISFAGGIFSAAFYLFAGLLADLFSPQISLMIILLCGLPTLFLYHSLYSHHKTV